MIRRLALTPLALLVPLAVVLAACNQAPARPEISDPKEILAETVASLKDVKSLEFTTAFSGNLTIAELGGNMDLSTVTMSGAVDIDGEKFKFTLDAPTIMGTKIEALGVDGSAYLKISGLLAGMMGGSADKWMKSDMGDLGADAVTDPAEFDKQLDEFRTALDELPNPPTKGADEACGDTQCYHVTITASAEDLEGVDGMAGMDGDASVDIFSRKSDLRPARVVMTITSAEIGTVTVTFNLTYDVTVNVEAPPADQVVEG